MDQPSPDYKSLFYAEQDRRKAEQEKRKAAEHAQAEEQEKRKAAEKKLRKTTLPELLDACHVHLQCALNVQLDKTLTTHGDPSNANKKKRPERVVEWTDFMKRQAAIWDDIQHSDFIHQQYFTSSNALEASGDAIRERMMSSELDLHYFERQTVEEHVSSIVKHLYNDATLRKTFGLKGSVQFENHSNTLKPDLSAEEHMTCLSLDEQNECLEKEPESSTSTGLTAAATAKARRVYHPRADQFCVYNVSSKAEGREDKIAAFICEFKAPHKLQLDNIYEGLEDMDLDQVVICRETDGPKDHIRRLVAAVITQAYSYMIDARLEFGYVCTGEAFIFLRVPDDPTTVCYFLSVPKHDVGETTGLAEDSGERNRLHLTAVGQMLAFTLQAVKAKRRSVAWLERARDRLNTWEVVYGKLLDKVPKKEMSSEYRPPRHKKNIFLRTSPIQLRRTAASIDSIGCRPRQDESQSSDDEFDPDLDSPSRRHQERPRPARPLAQASKPVSNTSSNQRSQDGKTNMQYCTQKCLRGLMERCWLDKTCPNAQEHGESRHEIDQPTFLSLMSQQLSKDLDTDCSPVGVHGARGALFTVRLTSHGYTVAAKCTTIDFVHHLKHEAIIYQHLRPIQGIHVPVYLGSIDLDRSYIYDGFAEIVHMMFLGYGGQPLFHQTYAKNKSNLTGKVERSIQAIHRLGVLHQDLEPRNILCNAELTQTMVIDFERAKIREPRAILGVLSHNRKRRWETEGKTEPDDVFGREFRLAMIELG